MKTCKFKEIEFVEMPHSSGNCVKCIFYKFDDCIDFIDNLLLNSHDCQNGYCIYKENWVQCTKENTNVGDTVKLNRCDSLYKVIYVLKGDGEVRFIGRPVSDNHDNVYHIEHFKVDLNKK